MRFKRKLLQTSVMLALAVPVAVHAASLEERVSDLEDMLTLTEENNDALSHELESRMRVSGYTDVEFISEKNKDSRFRMHHLSLFFQKKLDANWRFFSEIEYEDGPLFEGSGGAVSDADGKIFAEAINLTYQLQPEAIFRFGRFFTPAGIWSVDHYPPFVPTQERPMHIRKIFPQLVDGAMVYGTVRAGGSFLNYNFYVGNGEGNNGHGDNNSDKAVGVKASVVFPVSGIRYAELGASYYADTLEVTGGQHEKSAAGIHAKLSVNDFAFQTEYASASYDEMGGAAAQADREGYYAQLIYSPNQWSGGVRYDYYDAAKNDNNDVTTDSLFVNYRFSPNTVGKVEYHIIDDTSAAEKSNKTIFSIATYLE